MDKGTGKETHITITSSTNMRQEDIDRAVKDAEKFAEEDKKQKEAVDTKNHAETLIFQSEKTIGEIGDKLPEEDKADVKAAIEKLRTTLAGGDTAAIKADSEALEKAFYALSEKLYKQQGGAEGAGPDMGAGAGNAGGEGFYNADFEDKTDK